MKKPDIFLFFQLLDPGLVQHFFPYNDVIFLQDQVGLASPFEIHIRDTHEHERTP